MNFILMTFSNWLTSYKEGKKEPFPQAGEGAPVVVQLSTAPQTTVKVMLGRTIPISADYEFARIQVGITLVGEQAQEKELFSLAASYVKEILERELESKYNLGRENEPFQEIPLYVSMGELTLGYSKTFKGLHKQHGLPETFKIEVEQTKVFAPQTKDLVLTYNQVVQQLHEQYAELDESL